MITVKVKLFAASRDAAGTDHLSIELPNGASIATVHERLVQQFPAMATILQHASFAINAEYATTETTVPDGAEVACIPPVSGG